MGLHQPQPVQEYVYEWFEPYKNTRNVEQLPRGFVRSILEKFKAGVPRFFWGYRKPKIRNEQPKGSGYPSEMQSSASEWLGSMVQTMHLPKQDPQGRRLLQPQGEDRYMVQATTDDTPGVAYRSAKKFDDKMAASVRNSYVITGRDSGSVIRQAFMDKYVHKKLHKRVASWNDEDLVELGKIDFKDQFKELGVDDMNSQPAPRPEVELVKVTCTVRRFGDKPVGRGEATRPIKFGRAKDNMKGKSHVSKSKGKAKGKSKGKAKGKSKGKAKGESKGKSKGGIKGPVGSGRLFIDPAEL